MLFQVWNKLFTKEVQRATAVDKSLHFGKWLCHSYETTFFFPVFLFPPSSHSYCYDFSVSQPRWQRLRFNSLFGAVYFKPPQSQTGSARRCSRQAEIEENNVFCSPSLRVCLALWRTEPPLLASHLSSGGEGDVSLYLLCHVVSSYRVAL